MDEMAGTFESKGIVTLLAERLQSQEAPIRLLLAMLAGYPIAFVYRCLILPLSSKPLHHIFFALSGYGLWFFIYGWNSLHSLICILTTYVLVCLLHNSPKRLIAASLIFNMGYLLTGNYCIHTNEYKVRWTTSHCVLALRLIGFAFDIADGRKPRQLLSKDQMNCYLERVPSLLELAAFAYFPCACLVGPQFPYRRYQRFMDGEFAQIKGYVKVGFTRLVLGISYMTIHHLGVSMLPNSYFLTDAYRNEPYVWRLIYLSFWAKFCLYKYVACWLLTEGSLMCLGFTYNGKFDDGTNNWYGCSNVSLYLFETGRSMDDYIRSFNVNTNHWMASYIYKRLKFLNNRDISYGATLVFIAIWHGFHSGYYVTFLLEYVTIEQVYQKSFVAKYFRIESSKKFQILKFVALKSYNLIYMGFCLTPFMFLTYDRWFEVIKAVKFFGFYYVGIWLFTFQAYKTLKLFRKANNRATNRATDLSPTTKESESDFKDHSNGATDLTANVNEKEKDN